MPIPFNKIRFENLEEILKIIEEILSKHGIDFYLIGAVARDIHLTGIHDIEPPRATQDIDYAILVQDDDIFAQLIHELVNAYSFAETELPYRFRYGDGTLIDLLPFGDIESDKRTVVLTGRTIEELSVIGFQENLPHTEEIEFEDGFKVQVSSLAGICLLKFFSWEGKPYDRERDIIDIDFIISKYTDIFIDEIFEIHDDLLDLDWDTILPPRLLGRHIGLILNNHPDSKTKLINLLENQLKEDSILPVLFTRINKKPITDNIQMIKDIISGVHK